jgi:hypothetical protein
MVKACYFVTAPSYLSRRTPLSRVMAHSLICSTRLAKVDEYHLSSCGTQGVGIGLLSVDSLLYSCHSILA